MKITDAAVQAALEAVIMKGRHIDYTDIIMMRSALTAAYPHFQPVDVAELKAEHEKEITEVIKERDQAEAWADKLSRAIGGESIGEHSNINNPWANALEIAENRKPVDVAAVREQCADIAKSWGDTARNLGQVIEASIANDIEKSIRALSAEPALKGQQHDKR